VLVSRLSPDVRFRAFVAVQHCRGVHRRPMEIVTRFHLSSPGFHVVINAQSSHSFKLPCWNFYFQNGYRMQRPEGCPDSLYGVMRECWHPAVSRLHTIPFCIIIFPDPWHFGSDPHPDPWTHTLDYGSRSGSVSCSFSQWLPRCQQKMSFFLIVLLITFRRFIYTSVLKDKQSLKSHYTAEINIFIIFFACWWKDPKPIWICIQLCHNSCTLLTLKICFIIKNPLGLKHTARCYEKLVQLMKWVNNSIQFLCCWIQIIINAYRNPKACLALTLSKLCAAGETTHLGAAGQHNLQATRGNRGEHTKPNLSEYDSPNYFSQTDYRYIVIKRV
jgi:hypothetical protein